MNEVEKIELLRYLCDNYSINKNIYRDKDKKLSNIPFKEYQNFLIWGKENGSINFFNGMGNDYNSFVLALKSGIILEEIVEVPGLAQDIDQNIIRKFVKWFDWKWLIGILVTIILAILAMVFKE